MAVAGEVTWHGGAHPYSWLVTIVSLRSRNVMKQTTEVSGIQIPEACSLLSGVSPHQVLASAIPARYYISVSPSGIMWNFLAILCSSRHSFFMRKICLQLWGYSEFDQYSLRWGIFFQSPQGCLDDMGQSDDLVSLLFWEVIVDVMDNSTYKLAVFGATSSLGQKVC